MDKIKTIIDNVRKDVTEDTIMVSYSIDIDAPAFMCSPYDENWIWSKKTIDLNKFLYDVLVPEYLINLVAIFNSDRVEDKFYSLDEAMELFKLSDKYSQNMDKYLVQLKDMYLNYNDNEISYIEFIKMLIKWEDVLKHIGILFDSISYANPYETRTSDMLKTDKFDYVNLSNNF